MNWRALRNVFADAAEYVIDRKKRFIFAGVGGVLLLNGYSTINSPEFVEKVERERQAEITLQAELQQFAVQAQVKGPGQGVAPVGALSYLFDFNTNKVTISGENGAQQVTFDSVYKGELAKKVKETICNDAARRDRFGLHYCQQ